MTACREILPQVTYCNDPYDCAQSAHGLVIVTEWNQFRKLGLGRIREVMAEPVVVDLRNIHEPQRMAAAGFDYHSLGRPHIQRNETAQ